MMQKCVVGHTPMEAIVALGVSATVLSFANIAWGTSFYNPIINLVGKSTTGKSTAAKLFSSFSCRPEGEGSYFLSFLATDNAIVKRIGDNQGFPCAIDEFSTSMGKKAWSDFVYILSNGYEKDRCCSGGADLQQSSKFNTVILTNGEISMLRKCNRNEGIRARLFDITDVEWTRSAEEADCIKQVVSENYGLLTVNVATELLKSSDKWHNVYIDWYTKVKSKMEEDKICIGIGERVSKYVALFTTSCELAKEIWHLDFDVYKVFEFFYFFLIVVNAEDANIGIRAYDAIVQYIARNQDKFVEVYAGFGAGILPQGMDGFRVHPNRTHKVNGKEYDEYYVFMPERMEEILNARGFPDINVTMKELMKHKLLNSKGDRPTKPFLVNELKTNVYAVWVETQSKLFMDD